MWLELASKIFLGVRTADPQRLKPAFLAGLGGTAEAIPYSKPILETTASGIANSLYWTFTMDSYLERLRQELENATAGITPADLGKGPAGKWNGGQILEHLYLTYRNTNKGISRYMEKGVPLATRATLKHRLATLLVVNVGYLPSGAKAPERAAPRGMPPQEVLAAIVPEIREMDSGLAECERKFGAKTKIMDPPIMGPLTAGQWRKFHWVDERHHARQIRERLRRV